MKFIWQYLRQYKKLLFGALALATINQIFSLLDPQIFRLLIDKYASRAKEIERAEFIQGIILLLLAFIGTALISRIAKNFQDYFVNVITQRIGAGLYAKSVRHSFSLPYAVFEDQRSGEHLQKLQKAKTDTQAFIISLINIVFLSLIGILFVILYASYVQVMIGIIYLSLIPIIGITTFVISKKIRAAQKNIVAKTAELAGSTTETLRNVQLVKSLGLENQEIERLNSVNDKILQLELEKVVIVRKFSFIQGSIINAARSGLLFLMLWFIFQGDISLGEFLSLYIYSFFIFQPLSELGMVAAQYQEARASNEQLNAILKIPPETKPEHPEEVGILKHIQFKSISFSYDANQNQTIKNVNVDMRSGETIAFVGPSGSGKSTLVKLLVGLYKPSSGSLLFNNTDSQKIDLEKLRMRIGLVAQDTQLFAGTIRENLLFVNPRATDADCMRVMELSAATSVLERGKEGLNTKIGEGGIKISGGEKRRLAIARALLRNPDLIIFDEATSSLDSITEKEITQTIQNIEIVKPEVITILIAHRLSTVAHAKRIYVLEKGEIIEQGAHNELLNLNGLYNALWREQVASRGE